MTESVDSIFKKYKTYSWLNLFIIVFFGFAGIALVISSAVSSSGRPFVRFVLAAVSWTVGMLWFAVCSIYIGIKNRRLKNV